MLSAHFRRFSLVTIGVLALLSSGSCSGTLFLNQSAIRRGNVLFQFLNKTQYRASFSFGTYDNLDLNPPGPVTLEQIRVSGGATSAEVEVPCRRLAAVATQAYVDRVTVTREDRNASDFDADSFGPVINFSSADSDSPGAALPTQGTAEGMERLLGVDFSCGDLLIFAFVEDPAAPGGFRVDFEVVVDTLDNNR